SGELDSVVKVTDNTVFRARLSPDGRVLAIAGRRDRTRQVEVQLIDVATASPAAEPIEVPLRSLQPADIAWDPRSAALAVSDGCGIRIAPLDGRTPTVLTVGRSERERAAALAWHPVSGLACASSGGRLFRWRDPTAEEPDVWDFWDDIV